MQMEVKEMKVAEGKTRGRIRRTKIVANSGSAGVKNAINIRERASR
jgi:hypothetical protein